MINHGLDSKYEDLTEEEKKAFVEAAIEIVNMADEHSYKRPKMTTLLEEISELILSLRGKHDDPPELEMAQCASVLINLLWQWKMGYENHVNNIVTIRSDKDV